MSRIPGLASSSTSSRTTTQSRLRIPSHLLLLLISFLLFSAIAAQSTTSTAPASSTTPLYPAPTGWSYVGCYNETTLTNGTNGLRALNGGINEALDTMTVSTCLTYCKSNSYIYAGLEYTRECYCSQFLSSLSAKLPETSCDLSCKGNSSQLCGGDLALNVYTTKTTTKGAAAPIASQAPVSSILALGIAMGVLLCLA